MNTSGPPAEDIETCQICGENRVAGDDFMQDDEQCRACFINSIKENDVYRWSRKLEFVDQRSIDAGTVHWACSRIAIVKNGRLIDTYWGCGSSDKVVNPEKADLEFIGNLDDFDKATECVNKYYHPRDIMNLNHANSSRNNVYLRKGAVKSIEVMTQYSSEVVDWYKNKLRSAEYFLSDAQKERDQLSIDSLLCGPSEMSFLFRTEKQQ